MRARNLHLLDRYATPSSSPQDRGPDAPSGRSQSAEARPFDSSPPAVVGLASASAGPDGLRPGAVQSRPAEVAAQPCHDQVRRRGAFVVLAVKPGEALEPRRDPWAQSFVGRPAGLHPFRHSSPGVPESTGIADNPRASARTSRPRLPRKYPANRHLSTWNSRPEQSHRTQEVEGSSPPSSISARSSRRLAGGGAARIQTRQAAASVPIHKFGQCLPDGWACLTFDGVGQCAGSTCADGGGRQARPGAEKRHRIFESGH
jgi:hypothetical protein